jgi:NADPH:quinone reductase-like Zn-dependent oxidoreductase
MSGSVYDFDVCRIIVEKGVNIPDTFSLGDMVFGATPAGSLAEFTMADSNKIAKVPAGWSVNEAATLPTVYETAVTGFRKAGLTPETPLDSILVIGASRGSGLAAFHMAKRIARPRTPTAVGEMLPRRLLTIATNPPWRLGLTLIMLEKWIRSTTTPH